MRVQGLYKFIGFLRHKSSGFRVDSGSRTTRLHLGPLFCSDRFRQAQLAVASVHANPRSRPNGSKSAVRCPHPEAALTNKP